MNKHSLFTIATAGAAIAFFTVDATSVATAQMLPPTVNQDAMVLVNRTTLAVSYPEGKKTSVDMIGAGMSLRSRGKAELERKDGRTRIKVKLENLLNPQSLGGWYTTYVVWAISPEGQADNLGQLRLKNGNEAEFDATTPFQTFGLIVTAEPHPLVKLPGSAMIAENILRKDTKGSVQSSTIEYRYDGFDYGTTGVSPDFITPLPVLGARRAVDMARKAGAYQYAESELQQAENQLLILERTWPRNRNNASKYSQIAMDTVRLAEVARESSQDRYAIARLEAEKQSAANQVARAREAARESREEAESYKLTLEQTRRELDAARATLENAQTDAEKAKAREEIARLEAAFAKADAERAKDEAEKAKQESEQAKTDLLAARQALDTSISSLLETRREARGLIINLSDIQFDFNQATLKPGAREKLSKLAGILLAFQGQYHLDIEGHTDAIGTDQYNEKLSLSRAEAVRAYLMQAGIPADRLSPARGLGKASPVASNETPEGRQLNRRVEIVVDDQVVAAAPPPQP